MTSADTTGSLESGDTLAAVRGNGPDVGRQDRDEGRGGRTLAGKILAYTALGLLAVIALVPFIWMLSSSVKTNVTIFSEPWQIIPPRPQWSNYSKLWDELPIGRWIFNSTYIVVIAVIGRVIFTATAAYAFARLRFPGRDYIFYGFLTALMIPTEVTLIPGFVLIRQLDWYNSHLALIVPQVSDAFAIFLLRQFFLSIPKELEEAARIDGASYFRVFYSIILPLSKSALAVVAVLAFMDVWNAFLWPLVMIDEVEKFTLPVGLQFLNSAHSTDWPALMAGNVIGLIPVVVVYLLAQKYFVEGITMSGLKG
ncbi:MAG TPA: carbohydrate ABC transporter permease [Propionibacteriaceae bacterium]|nr:carbohydrate ABC transporter permease [Propionibacteriaceae bacterium]